MSKDLLIVETDADLSSQIQVALEAKGFAIELIADGKAAVDRARQQRPDLIVLAAELGQGQSGYLICRELKKDNSLKSIPVVITGDPEKFDGHKKLKTRAEDYVAKPMDLGRLVQVVGGIIGFPEGSVEVDDSLSLSELVEEEIEVPVEPDLDFAPEPEPEEISVEADADAQPPDGDSDLAALDSAFDGMTSEPESPEPQDPFERTNTSIETMAEEELPVEEDDTSLIVDESFSDGDEGAGDAALNALEDSAPPVFEPDPPPPPRAAPTPPAPSRPVTSRFRTSAGDSVELMNELRTLRARLAEVEASAEDANARAQANDGRVQELESELAAQATELDRARTSGKSDKEFFSLRDAVNKKDKELLKLKSELHDRETEIIELKDRETQLEQVVSEAQNGQAQMKTLTSKVEQLTADKRRLEGQMTALRDEARGATSQLSVLQMDLDQARATVAELEQMRSQAEGIDIQLQEAQSDLSQVRGEVDALKGEVERAQQEAESAKGQLTSQATAFADEMSTLRRRLAELDEAGSKNEERVGKLYARIRGDEKLREKTKKALSIALQLLEEQQAPAEPAADEDEALA